MTNWLKDPSEQNAEAWVKSPLTPEERAGIGRRIFKWFTTRNAAVADSLSPPHYVVDTDGDWPDQICGTLSREDINLVGHLLRKPPPNSYEANE